MRDYRRHGLQSEDRPGHPRRESRLSPRRKGQPAGPPRGAARRRTVDNRDRRRIGAFDERSGNALPRPALASAIVPIDDRRIRPVFIAKRAPAGLLAQPMDDAADDAAIILALRPGVDHQGCGAIAAHCLSRSQQLSDTNKALSTDLNYDDFQLNWVRSRIGNDV